MKHFALVAAVMAALSSAAEAQHSDHVAVHPALTLWEEGNPHAGVAVTWRKNIWRNWGLNAGYILTTSLDHYQHHYDNIVWVGAERSFGSPDQSVPYVLLGSVAGGYHTLHRRHRWGFFAFPGIGAGIRHWNAERTWFVAPEVQFAMNSVLTFNFGFGFGLSRNPR